MGRILTIIAFISVFGQFALSQNTVPNAQLKKEVHLYLTDAADGNELALLFEVVKEGIKYFMPVFDSIPTINPLNPKNQDRISSGFGMRFHPNDKVNKPHYGIDLTAEIGTPIHAAADGIVTYVNKSDDGYGNEVRIKHAYGFTTRYGHMYTYVVKKGSKVEKGEIIGYLGNTGNSTGPHVHFEVRKNGKAVNPEYFLGIPMPSI